MDSSLDRRAFVRHSALVALGAPVASALGCTIERQPSGEVRELGPARPILLPWGSDAVRIAAPAPERPVAYMSHRYMRIWLDLEFRDRLHFALGAHISVSTQHWRIPLPGDPTNVPIQAGDPRREFEEFDIRTWDADIEPVEGDVRVFRGSPVPASIRIECQPLSGGGAWFSAEPIEVLRVGSPNLGLCREDLMQVGLGTRFSDRDCTRPEGPARLVTWASRGELRTEAP